MFFIVLFFLFFWPRGCFCEIESIIPILQARKAHLWQAKIMIFYPASFLGRAQGSWFPPQSCLYDRGPDALILSLTRQMCLESLLHTTRCTTKHKADKRNEVLLGSREEEERERIPWNVGDIAALRPDDWLNWGVKWEKSVGRLPCGDRALLHSITVRKMCWNEDYTKPAIVSWI